MSAAKNLQSRILVGERSGTQWTVEEQIQFAEGVSPGHFSVGYRVVDSDGRHAFLKATDLRMAALGDTDFLQKLKEKVDAHAFERRVLDHTRGANMDRIVIAVDFGNVEVIEEGIAYTVLFLVFEYADGGDLRQHVNNDRSLHLVSVLNVLHNLSNAIKQLHTGQICHNDIKPGNFLIFDDTRHKLGDLGRATTPLFGANHDSLVCAGDPQYAAPEQLYSASGDQFGIDEFEARRLGDLFSLGSIAHFLLCKRMITPELMHRLKPIFWPSAFQGGWTGDYEGALPYIRMAWGSVVADLMADQSPDDPYADVVSEMIACVVQLGDPDPRLRSRPGSAAGRRRANVEYYISVFDRLRRTVMVRQRARQSLGKTS